MIEGAEFGPATFSRWTFLASSAFGELEYKPLSTTFHGGMAERALGQLQFVTVSTSSLEVTRSKAHRERNGQDSLWVGIIQDGETILSHQDREDTLRSGDIVIYGSSSCYAHHIPACLSALFVKVPIDLAAQYFPRKATDVVQRISSRDGLGYISSSFLLSIAGQADTVGSKDSDLLVDSLLATLSLAFRDSPSSFSSVKRERLSLEKRIRLFIEANLDDEELSSSGIARAHGISHRYLNRIFARDDLTPSRYLVQRRLAKCREVLTNPGLSELSVSQIAFAHGFNDLSTFCRAFKAEFGVTARQCRELTLLQDGSH